MGRKPRVDRSPEEKWQIVQEGLKSGNVSETCRRYGIAPNLFYRWKDEANIVTAVSHVFLMGHLSSANFIEPVHGAAGQNKSRSITWAGKQEKVRPSELCFLLTSPFIELTRVIGDLVVEPCNQFEIHVEMACVLLPSKTGHLS
jgi:hypothetical protein